DGHAPRDVDVLLPERGKHAYRLFVVRRDDGARLDIAREQALGGVDARLHRKVATQHEPRIDLDAVATERVDICLVTLVALLVPGRPAHESDLPQAVHLDEVRSGGEHRSIGIDEHPRNARKRRANRQTGQSETTAKLLHRVETLEDADGARS